MIRNEDTRNFYEQLILDLEAEIEKDIPPHLTSYALLLGICNYPRTIRFRRKWIPNIQYYTCRRCGSICWSAYAYGKEIKRCPRCLTRLNGKTPNIAVTREVISKEVKTQR